MSLIPYSSSRDSRSVVLRHQQTLVVYDPHSRQLALREASPAASPESVEFQTCPYCKRPMHMEEPSQDHNGPSLSSPMAEPGFVDQDYFRMLELSMPPDEIPTEDSPRRPPQSPTRRRLPRPEVEEVGEGEGIADKHGTGGSQPGINSAAFSPKYFQRFFVTEGELGKGGKGVVLLVRHVLDGVSLGHFACKRVPVGDNHKWLEKVLMEVQLLQRLSHTNLVSYRHVWLENVRLTTFGPSVPCAFILQQYCNSGDLHNYVLDAPKQTTKDQLKDQMRRRTRGQPELPQNTFKPRRIPLEHIISFFRDIASGLSFLHSNGFIHRDLKPSNCLLNDTGIPGQELRVLVSDFGEVQMENTARNSTGATGTISYCAPEVLRRVQPDGNYGNFTTKSDVFSLGMILHFICFGKLPYVSSDEMNEENENLDDLRKEIMAWKGLDEKSRLRTDLPEKLYQSLQTLISPDPSIRPSAEEILVGIEMGIGEDAVPLRRTSSGSGGKPIVIEDNQALGFRRISPIADTPPPATPTGSSTNLNRDYSTFNEMRPPKREAPRRGSRLSTGAISSDDIQQAESSSSPEPNSLVLRPRLESPNIKLPRALPPVPRTRSIIWARRLRFVVRKPVFITGVKLVVFLAKTVMLTRPCSPLSTNPWLYYPLLSLAALDFSTPFLTVTAVLAVVHIFILFLAGLVGVRMCLY